jgi:hypothetical protein
VARAAPVTMAASSRSLLVRVPSGLEKLTKRFWTSGGNGERHTTGRGDGVHGEQCEVGNQNPPIPALDASVAPIKVGAIGTKEANGTGVAVVSCASRSQSVSDWRTRGEILSLGPGWSTSTCCRMENRCLA